MGAWAIGCMGSLAHRMRIFRGDRWIYNITRASADDIAHIRGGLLIFTPSAGEVTSAIPLISVLRERHPALSIILCVNTSSGLTLAKREGLTAFRVTPHSVAFFKRLLNRLEPKGMVVVQVAHVGGLPVNLTSAVAANGLPIVVVNGYLPDIDMRHAQTRFWHGMSKVYSYINLYCLQTQADADCLESLGVEPERIAVVGNMKFDAALSAGDQEFPETLATELGINRSEVILAAGSTHSGEEKILLEAYRNAGGPEFARMIIAPRTIARSPEVLQLAKSMGFSASLRTDVQGKPDVIVLNTIGELRKVYSLSSISLVGGTLVPIGGHNVLEPAVLGKPVLIGPHTHHTSGVAEMLIDAGGAIGVDGVDELSEKLSRLFREADMRDEMGAKAAEVVRQFTGVAERCAYVIEDMIEI